MLYQMNFLVCSVHSIVEVELQSVANSQAKIRFSDGSVRMRRCTMENTVVNYFHSKMKAVQRTSGREVHQASDVRYESG